jgi:hypothetical protein
LFDTAAVLELAGKAAALELVSMAATIMHNPLDFIKVVTNHMVAVNP